MSGINTMNVTSMTEKLNISVIFHLKIHMNSSYYVGKLGFNNRKGKEEFNIPFTGLHDDKVCKLQHFLEK